MVRKNVAEILANHVTFELEAIDRMYLNAYVPSLQTGGGFVWFVKTQLGARVPSTLMVAPMSQRFVEAIERFVASAGDRPGDVREGATQGRRRAAVPARRSTGEEGVLFVGKAQEKASVFRTEKRRDAPGKTYPWIIRSTAMVNHYYVYILDRDFGPLFIKFCSYFPYAAKLCLNGHEWLKRQLTQRRHAVRAVGQWDPLERGGRAACNGSPTRWTPPRSTRSFANGSGDCRIRLRPRTAPPAIAISSRSCRAEFALDPSPQTGR